MNEALRRLFCRSSVSFPFVLCKGQSHKMACDYPIFKFAALEIFKSQQCLSLLLFISATKRHGGWFNQSANRSHWFTDMIFFPNVDLKSFFMSLLTKSLTLLKKRGGHYETKCSAQAEGFFSFHRRNKIIPGSYKASLLTQTSLLPSKSEG